MPSLDQSGPKTVVTEWLKRKGRRVKETPSEREQRWFEGTFKDANNAEHNEDEREEKDSDKSQLKTRIF